MEGVRLSEIRGSISSKHIVETLNGFGLQVEEIYYPLHNNEAVVLFKDTSSTTKVLCEKQSGLTFRVCPLPHKLISKVTVELEGNAGALMCDAETKSKLDKQTKGRVKVKESHGKISLEGGQFDIELAINILSQEIEEQFSLANTRNGHDPALASSKSLQNTSFGKVASPRASERKSVAADIVVSASAAKPSKGYEHITNGEISGGTGFSHVQGTSVKDYNRGRNSREADSSDTFNKFVSLPLDLDQSSHSKSIIDRELTATKESYQRESFAVGERNLDLSNAELNHRRDRDHEYSSFSSTFIGDASMLRDLDKAPKEDIAAIEKWVKDTRRKPDDLGRDERGSSSTDELLKDRSEETHAMSYEYGRYQEGENKSTLRNNLVDTTQPMRPPRASEFADETKNFEFDLPGGIVVKVHCGNIVKIRTDGIVNAANSELQHYAGVAGAIERACGRSLTRECDRYIHANGPLNVSEVMHTTSGDLIGFGTSYILHTVGPVYVDTLEAKCGNLLTCTFLRCLDYARTKLRIRSIAFPFISSGVYGAPLDLCVESFLDAVVMYAKTHQGDTMLREIHLVNTDLEMVQTAIVMIKQHLEQGFEVLISKAMSRLERKSNSPRSPRSEVKSTRNSSSVKRSSSLTRTTTKHSERSEFSSLRPEDLKNYNDEPRSLKPTPRVRSGSFNAPRTNSSDKARPASATASLASDSQKTTHSPKQIKYIGRSASDFKTRPVTTIGVQRSKTGPMRATPSLGGAYDESYTRETQDVKLSHTYHGDEDFHSLPADVNRNREGRPLPVPRKRLEDEKCPICMDPIQDSIKLEKCGHVFCKGCIRQAFKQRPACPVCGKLYGSVTGDQPRGGRMSNQTLTDVQVPGYKAARGAISIEYYFPGGLQEDNHPNPGKRYAGIKRTAYLPNNTEGREVLRLLEKAFKAGLTFTIGESRTTGHQGVITWNDIHHKTSLTGGPENYGYPDADYMRRVKDELAAKGITS